MIAPDYRCETCGLTTAECLKAGGLSFGEGHVWHIRCAWNHREAGKMVPPKQEQERQEPE